MVERGDLLLTGTFTVGETGPVTAAAPRTSERQNNSADQFVTSLSGAPL
jgi:hypothetical protein